MEEIKKKTAKSGKCYKENILHVSYFFFKKNVEIYKREIDGHGNKICKATEAAAVIITTKSRTSKGIKVGK